MPEQPRKILLVDDTLLIRKLARATLAGENVTILEAENGTQALDIARSEKPGIIFLDINLSDISGFKLCESMRTREGLTDTHIIILSDEVDDQIRELGKKAGADGFLTKPFSPIELLKKVHGFFHTDEEAYKDLTGGKREDIHSTLSLNGKVQSPAQLMKLKEEQLFMYALDLSRLHQKEIQKTKELRKAYKKLKEIEKMKDTFIALVSHELRTPLSVIKGYLYLLSEVLNKAPIDQDVSSFMKPITKATNRLENLMGELLDFSRMKSGLMTFEKKEINVPDFMNLILQEYSSGFKEKNIEVKLEVKSEFRPIKADYGRLKEAFAHFVKNALNFTNKDGKFLIECVDEGIWIEVRFIDSGQGIPQDKLEKIFNPFYQAADFLTREVGGMGLGLSIAKHIIEDHGGSINVNSTPGKGSSFAIRLPRSYQDAKEIVAELNQTYPRQIEELSRNLKATQEQLLAYAQELSSVYAREKQRTEELEESLNALERTYIQTIAALSRSVDTKDAYQGGHTDRVSYFAYAIAKRMNPELVYDRNFKYSLLLHDIGKIGVAEEILRKVDKLTEEEWLILKGHAIKGVEILKDVEFLAPALNAVRSHHERWDGKGYPDGLKGEEIPLGARIIAVADSFDAMTTDRPYRKGMSLEKAKDEITRQAGHQFDPEVVRCFLECWDEIEAYANSAKETAKLQKRILDQELMMGENNEAG